MGDEYAEVPRAERMIPTAARRQVIERDGMVCQLCRIAVQTDRPRQPDSLHLDHIKEWASGGTHDADNLRVTCARCNLGRGRPQVIIRAVRQESDEPQIDPALRKDRLDRAARLRDLERDMRHELARIGRMSYRQRQARP